jgi:hypothetical protein
MKLTLTRVDFDSFHRTGRQVRELLATIKASGKDAEAWWN